MKLGIIVYFDILLVPLSSFCAAICDIGWQEYSGYCYYVSSTSATWYQADEDCKNMGAQLTSIRNFDEQNFILQIIDSYSPYWIGLTTTCSVSDSGDSQRTYCNLRWTDKSSTAYIAEYLGDTFGNCWLINPLIGIKETDCTDEYVLSIFPVHYICKKEASVVLVPEVPLVTSGEEFKQREISSTPSTQTIMTTEISPMASSEVVTTTGISSTISSETTRRTEISSTTSNETTRRTGISSTTSSETTRRAEISSTTSSETTRRIEISSTTSNETSRTTEILSMTSKDTSTTTEISSTPSTETTTTTEISSMRSAETTTTTERSSTPYAETTARTERSSMPSTETTITTEISPRSLITTFDMFISAKLDARKVIPVVVAVAVVVPLAVIVVAVVCMKRRKKASSSPKQQQQQQHQQQPEHRSNSEPPTILSAPHLEALYDCRTESMTVPGSVLHQEDS